MTDVRALLAAERQSRRISHPYLTYTKSGQILCNVCNLNVKSETLWEGHLRSANHKRNVQNVQEKTTKSLKRKIEDVDEEVDSDNEQETESRKKPKSRPESIVNDTNEVAKEENALPERQAAPRNDRQDFIKTSLMETRSSETKQASENTAPAPTTAEAIDEDEWAAFEREVAPLATTQPDYSSATISAAPVSAEQLARQATDDKRRQQETDAQDEREDEERRIEEEFDVMEEMEERMKKLREKREALRIAGKAKIDTGQNQVEQGSSEKLPAITTITENVELQEREKGDDEDDEDEIDDWYS